MAIATEEIIKQIDEMTVLELNSLVKALDRIEAAVNLDNATDAVVWDQCGLPQPGRTFRLQIRVW